MAKNKVIYEWQHKNGESSGKGINDLRNKQWNILRKLYRQEDVRLDAFKRTLIKGLVKI